MRFRGFAGCRAGFSGKVGGTASAPNRPSPSGVISVSSSGVSGTNGEVFTTPLDVTSLVPLQVKHREADPNTFLSHILHLLNELGGSAAVGGPGAGVTGSVGAVLKVRFVSGFDVARNVSELSTVSCTLVELGCLNSCGSTPGPFRSDISLAASYMFDILGRSHEDSGMLDKAATCSGKEGEGVAARSLVELHISLEDRGGE